MTTSMAVGKVDYGVEVVTEFCETIRKLCPAISTTRHTATPPLLLSTHAADARKSPVLHIQSIGIMLSELRQAID